MEQLTRRTLITGLAGVIAAPAIVRATSLMPVKAFPTMERLFINDIEVMEVSQIEIEEICRWFCVPPHMLGNIGRAISQERARVIWGNRA